MFTFIDSLRSLTTFIPVEWLMYFPLIAAIITVVISILLYRFVNYLSVKRQKNPLYSTRNMKIGGVIFAGAIGYAVGSALAFLYIFLWPNDPRWSGGFQGVDVPGVNTPDASGGILGSSGVQRLFEGFTGGINNFSDELEGELNQKLEPVILIDAYKHAFITAAPLLGHFVAGLAVVVLLGAIVFFWSQGAIPVKVYTLEASVHRLKDQVVSLWSATKLYHVSLRQLRQYNAYNTYCHIQLVNAHNRGQAIEVRKFEPNKDYAGWLSKNGFPAVPGEGELQELEALSQKAGTVRKKKTLASIRKR